MDFHYQVVIGTAIVSILITIYGFYKSYLKTSKEDNESQTMAKWSIIFGLSGIILAFVGSIIGIILALLCMRNKKHKGLSILGLSISILTILPWFLLLINGE